MSLTEQQRAFVEHNHGAAMIALRPDGTPSAVRIGVALVDGQLWSSGTQTRRRSAYIRRDPRATVFVFEAGFRFLTIESRVTLLEGPDAPAQNVRLFRVMQGRSSGPLSWFGGEYSEEKFLALMASEQRLIYQFEPVRAYGTL
ncbi:MAG: pyridoxamine 5'-phosphate oxidase family protein [Chloroflexota bacterium]|nr:pyridoxamine 5'-phosphate oxidase family protein [Chloroflexota bacterium]